jgi:hypothetical protein
MIMMDYKNSVRLLCSLWLGLIVLVGCAEVMPNQVEPYPAAQVLLGKTKQALLACAGPPISEEHVKGRQVILIYYKEASQLEESFASSKSSFAKVHHGCRASILLEEDWVTGVQYDSEPSSFQDDEHCDEIFQPCLSP